jgi:TonB family protein
VKQMTIQRACLFSLGIHFLLFGTAIAFAQFSRGVVWGHRDVIMVSLVGPGAGSADRGLSAKGDEGSRSSERPALSHTRSKEAASDPASVQPVQDIASLPLTQNIKQEGSDLGSAGGGKSGGEENRSGDGPSSAPVSGFGLITSEQWAVISSAIERSKNYPRMARERGIQGVVHVRFRVSQSGAVENVEIVKSSGSDILDTASVRTLYRAGPMPYVSGWVEVPIAYVLK